jgi:hypothetical protein
MRKFRTALSFSALIATFSVLKERVTASKKVGMLPRYGWEILSALRQADCPMSARNLENMTGISALVVADNLEGLRRLGLVTGPPEERLKASSRSCYFKITSLGRRLLRSHGPY